MHSGTEQDQRLPGALHPGYILPDELTLAERVRLLLGHAAQLHFASGDGSDAGRWDDALRGDESMLLADIVAYPLEALQESFARAWPWAGEAHLWRRVRRLLHDIDRWCQWLARHETSSATQVRQAMLRPMGTGLRELLHEAIHSFGLDDEEASRLHGVWRLDVTRTERPSRFTTPELRLQLLRRLWGGLCMAVDRLRPLAREQLPHSLRNGRHEPAMGLLLTAVQLLQDTRAPLNRFPERVTDFYYGDLLHMRPRAPALEHAYLRLLRDPHYRAPVQVRRGDRFLAGKDAQGQAIEFAAGQTLEVSDNQVAVLCSLRLERDRLISPEKELGYATRVLAQSIPLQAPDAADAEAPAWWPLLGGKRKGTAATAQPALLGLALATPMLALKEGSRRIKLVLRLSHPGYDDEALLTLLRRPGEQRSAEWLGQVFARFDRYEAKNHPSRLALAAPDADALAAWKRAPRPDGDVQLCHLVARCLATTNPLLFHERLGRLFAAWLAAAGEDLQADDVAALRAHAAALPDGDGTLRVEIDDPLILIYPHEHGDGQTLPDRVLIFARLFRDVWRAELSTATGWLVLDDVRMRRDDTAGGPGGCIEIGLRLGPEQPSITPCQPALHGSAWPAQPMLRLLLQARARVCVYSLLQQWTLHDIVLGIEVRGARDVALYNQLGRLDAGKPFQPFGPMPTLGSYCVFGSAELARKPLRSLRLRLRWGQLPGGVGGFAERYRGYPGTWTNASFQVRPGVLRDGQWHGGTAGCLPLFRGDGRLDDAIELALPEADLALYHRAQMQPATPFTYGANTRNGFFRLELGAPDAAFGHGLYPHLLAEALTRNARMKKAKLTVPLPQEPYTPIVEQVSLDYTASQLITLKPSAEPSAVQLFHLYPFGHDRPQASAGTDGVSLLPRYHQDGQLYLGLSGTDPQGVLNLFFQLRAESALERWQIMRPRPIWSVWGEDGWRVLEADRLLSDGTLGFLRSGVVSLDLPAGMRNDASRLPGGLYWLRLSASGELDCFAGLYGAYAQVIEVQCVRPRAHEEGGTPLPAGTIKAPLHAIGGLQSVQQIGPSFGLRPPDVAGVLRARSAERLRHKNRTGTPWDYERLLLDAFPQLFKVKCFANDQTTDAAVSARPGGVLVVVVPAPRQGVLFRNTEAPRFDAAVLEQMTAHVRERSAPGIRIVVRNAAYERIQVRCVVRLARGSHPGTSLIRINRAIVEFLSPWHVGGHRAEFDWDIRSEAIEACLRELDEVEAVGAMSLLHVVQSDANIYQLHDTARRGRVRPLRQVRPVQPWSLALPTSHHLIELVDAASTGAAVATGVGKLEVGSTFIVGGNAPTSKPGTP
ncbi:MAG: hypothetical protein EPN68_11715 [Rhodanobacter sp.]|nr:MAG: hypothetical protein EPN68_11715 [Rhodanobacter sp.]